MTETNIITISNVQSYRQISTNMKTERFDAFQLEVLQTNLKQLLGEPLYYAFFKDFSGAAPATQKYKDLLDGKEYVLSSETIQYHGLKPFVIYHWLALFAREGDLFQASYGNVQFNNNTQQNMQSSKEKDKIVYNFLSKATEYENNIVQYLNEYSSTYPLWEGGTDKPIDQHNIIVM